MGCGFEITAVHPDSLLAEEAILAAEGEMRRIEKLISDWDSTSLVSAINRYAGIRPVKVTRELFDFIHRSIKISELTDGAFDITFAGMDKVWTFDGSMAQMPDSSTVQKSLRHVGYQKIILNAADTTVFLPEKGMKIGFGGNGQGFAARKAKALMLQKGIASGVVNASGEPTAWGLQPDGSPWRIGVTDPVVTDRLCAWLSVSDLTVATSGNYEKYVTFNGIRYGHIINPQTGYPSVGLTSVTIICPDPEIADALSTAVFVLGEKDGLALINRIKSVEAFLYTTDQRLVTSRNIKLNYY